MCVSSFIPERTTVTSGWFHTQRKAHSAGVLLVGASSQISFTAGGTVLVRFPPRRGSMMMTPRPFEAAYSRPCGTCLVLLVQEVVLDLAEVPVIGVHDPLEILSRAVEGKARVDYAAVGFGFVEEIGYAQLFNIVPQITDESMDEVIVDMVGIELLQLGIQETVHILPAFRPASWEVLSRA